jgi:acetyl-CoA acyltransferase
MKAIQEGYFKPGILPITVEEVYVNEKGKKQPGIMWWIQMRG